LPLLYHLLSSFLFQAVLPLPLAPPIFSFSFSGGASSHSCTAYFLFFLFQAVPLPLLHRLLSLFPFQAVLPLPLAPPIFNFSLSGGATPPSCTAYFLFFLFRWCFLSLLHRLLSVFPFQAVLHLTPAPPIFSFSFSGGASSHSCTAYFLLLFFRRCFLSLLHRLFSLFLFQAVSLATPSPPTFSFSFSGGASSHSCTAYFLLLFFRRCFLSPLHRLFSLFPFQAVLHLTLAPPTFSFSLSGGASSHSCTAYFLLFPFQAVLPLTLAPPIFSFFFSGGATPHSCTAYFLFFFFKRCFLSLLHRLFSLFPFQVVLPLTLAPPTFSFSLSGGATPPSRTAYFLFFLFRRCYTSLLHRLLSLFLFQAVLHLTPAPPTFSFSFSGGATPPYSSVGAPKHFTPYYSSSQTPPTPHKKPPLSFDKGGSLNAQTIKTWPLPFNFASSITYTLILRS